MNPLIQEENGKEQKKHKIEAVSLARYASRQSRVFKLLFFSSRARRVSSHLSFQIVFFVSNRVFLLFYLPALDSAIVKASCCLPRVL